MPAPWRPRRAGRIRPRSSRRRAIRSSTRCSGHTAGRRDRARRAGAAGSAADGDGAGAPARERRAVRAAGSTIEITARADRRGPGDSRFAITAPASPPADLPHLFERFYRGAAAKTRRLRHRHGPVDRPRTAGGRAGPRLGGELPGRRRAVHDRRARRRQGSRSRSSGRPHDASRLASCSSTTRSRFSARSAPLLRSRGYEVDDRRHRRGGARAIRRDARPT